MDWRKPLEGKVKPPWNKRPSNMFNLDQAIAEWRQQMLAAGIKSPVPLEELESHLRDEIEREMKSGLNELEAFHAAIQKIGQAHLIHEEFKKVETTKEDRKWKLAQILLLAFSSLFPFVVGRQVFYSEMTPGQKISGLAAVVVFSLLAWGGRLGCGIFPVIRARRIRSAVTNACCVLMMLWWIVLFNIILPRHDFAAGQLLVTILWGFITPAGAVIGLALGIGNVVRKKAAMTGS
jgi:hypothetical protein